MLRAGEELTVKSPNYDSREPYEDHTECTWLVEVSINFFYLKKYNRVILMITVIMASFTSLLNGPL